MLKTNFLPAGTLPATGICNSKVIGSSHENDEKLVKSDFTKSVCGVEEPSFLTLKARQAFTQLRQMFTKAPILQYFDSEHHIWIEINAFVYAIGNVLSQITSETGQWHQVSYYFWKMILAKMRYKTHNTKLLAMVKVFKNWRYYLKNYWYEVLVLTNHKKLGQFMNIRSLSSR